MSLCVSEGSQVTCSQHAVSPVGIQSSSMGAQSSESAEDARTGVVELLEVPACVRWTRAAPLGPQWSLPPRPQLWVPWKSWHAGDFGKTEQEGQRGDRARWPGKGQRMAFMSRLFCLACVCVCVCVCMCVHVWVCGWKVGRGGRHRVELLLRRAACLPSAKATRCRCWQEGGPRAPLEGPQSM